MIHIIMFGMLILLVIIMTGYKRNHELFGDEIHQIVAHLIDKLMMRLGNDLVLLDGMSHRPKIGKLHVIT